MTRPILNYTTGIDTWKTLSEIQQILSAHGVTHMSIKNEGSLPVSMIFTVETATGPLNFSLPCNYQGVLTRLKKEKKVPARLKNEEQALRVGWRIVKDWVEAQMAMVSVECASVVEVFMPYLVVQATGETLYKSFEKGHFKRLQ